jgi:spore maturation protein CgeB
MKIAMFYHSLVSDWNHGNAHFLRGTVKALQSRGHEVQVFEQENNWSLRNLIQDHGEDKIDEFYSYYPTLKTNFYNPENANLEQLIADADLVIVHEWNNPQLVADIGNLKPKMGFKLLFHDTHHRAVSDVLSMGSYDFRHYDGALVFGNVIREIYLKRNWVSRAWTWHEAADEDLFKPIVSEEKKGDLVWIGNWGDNERTLELMNFLIEPVKALQLKATVYGVRYSQEAIKALEDAGITYGGWLPNYKAPETFAQYKVTVHVPRGPYVKLLSGIPTIRPFEAMSSGIPLICSPWKDSENLFSEKRDYLSAANGTEMRKHLQQVLEDQELAGSLAAHGRTTILEKHTCTHRVMELEAIAAELGIAVPTIDNSSH